MKAPHLNRALLLEHEVKVADGAGGFARTWAALGTLWAELLPGTGRDPNGEEVVLSLVPYRITVRAAPAGADNRPKAGQRFREGVRVFTIQAVTERDADGRWLVCFCKEEAPK